MHRDQGQSRGAPLGDDAGTRRAGHLLGESHGTKVRVNRQCTYLMQLVCSVAVNVWCVEEGVGRGVERGVGRRMVRRSWKLMHVTWEGC